jgi:dTDP-4-dehydrorhamnose 3,5-epimerase
VLSFRDTEIAGVVIVETELVEDERGSFTRAYCQREFDDHGIRFAPTQVSLSTNTRRGTLRGLHYQGDPRAEAKLIRCVAGAAFDVAVDLRRDSPTYTRWASVVLSKANGRAVFIPEGCAHGFQALEDETALIYLISEFYDPDLQRGVRWDDPAIAVDWPLAVTAISDRDRAFDDLLI